MTPLQFLVNIILAVLGGILANLLLLEAELQNPYRVILAVVIALVLFSAKPANYFIEPINR